MDSKLKKNYIYNLIYQIFVIITPLFVTPYVARVLTEDGVGRYSFTYSIVTYFILVASFGFTTYGQRLIAQSQNDEQMQRKLFWEIIIARAIPFILSIIVYLVLLNLNIFKSNTLIMTILIIDIAATFFDITFYFQGNELFKKIMIRNVGIKLLSIALIFLFVKTTDDLYKYIIIQSLSALIGVLFLWPTLSKKILSFKQLKIKPLKHMKPALTLFIPTIAYSIYTVLDKTLIGLITGSDAENGYYQYATYIVKLSMSVFLALSTIMISRNSKLHAEANYKLLYQNIYKILRFVLFLAIPMMVGLICIADNFVPWYLGESYLKTATLIKYLSPIVVLIAISNVLGFQLLVPTGQYKKYTISICIGALTNLTANLLLIGKFNSLGAVIATVIAELFVLFIVLRYAKNEIKFKKILANSLKYLFAGGVMFIICYFLAINLTPSIINTAIIIATGVFIYFILLIIMKDQLIMNYFNLGKRILFKILKRNK